MVESRSVIGSHLLSSLLESACWPHQSETWECADEVLSSKEIWTRSRSQLSGLFQLYIRLLVDLDYPVVVKEVVFSVV